MAIKQTTIRREFRYNGIKLTDVAAEKTADQVRVFYAAQYPELLNAVVEGPVTKNGVSTYTFARAAGSKGVGHLTALNQITHGSRPSTGSPLEKATVSQIKENKACSTIVEAVVNCRTRSTPILPGAASYSRFG